ncbi:MAG: ParB/RepB/Spo0J family partition protein, partial [Bacteroidales bacterium]
MSKVKPSNFNPRKTFRDADLTELAESIKEQGVLQPIMVRPRGNEYEIVYGERRYRAALLAGLEIIPALVRDLTDNTAMEYALTENIQRQDVSPIEEAIAYKSLIENNHYDMVNLMNKFGKSESYIRSRMRLNSLIQPFA